MIFRRKANEKFKLQKLEQKLVKVQTDIAIGEDHFAHCHLTNEPLDKGIVSRYSKAKSVIAELTAKINALK